MAKYGIPYQGFKSAICDKLIQLFPKADHFYDLFGGGFSITHAMLVNRGSDYKQFHFNELNPLNVPLIKAAISGEFHYDKFKPKFVTRERFFEKKDVSGYVRYLWSFGNDAKTYLFGKDVELYKQSMHMAVVFGKFDSLATEVLGFTSWPEDLQEIKSRRLYLGRKIKGYRKHNTLPDCLVPFLSVKQRQEWANIRGSVQLEQLQQLERLERLERLNFYTLSYKNVPILPNSIVYCDPPYAGTKGYGLRFDHKEFLDWADRQEVPVYISEYNIDDPRFFEVWRTDKRKGMQRGATASKAAEKVYGNKVAWRTIYG